MLTPPSEQTRRFNAEVPNLLLTSIEHTLLVRGLESVPGEDIGSDGAVDKE